MGQQVFPLKGHHGPVLSAAFSPDGERLVSGSSDKTAKVWDMRTGQQILDLKGHTLAVNRVAFSPDGKRVFARDLKGKVLAWSAADGKPVDPVNPPALPPAGPARSPDGVLLAEARGLDVAVFDPVKLAKANHWPLPNRAERLRYHGEQARFAEKEKQWFATAFHLGKAADHTPWDRHARLEEAETWVQAAQPNRAAVAFLQALLTDPHGFNRK